MEQPDCSSMYGRSRGCRAVLSLCFGLQGNVPWNNIRAALGRIKEKRDPSGEM